MWRTDLRQRRLESRGHSQTEIRNSIDKEGIQLKNRMFSSLQAGSSKEIEGKSGCIRERSGAIVPIFILKTKTESDVPLSFDVASIIRKVLNI